MYLGLQAPILAGRFLRPEEGVLAQYAHIARNYLLVGYGPSKLGQMWYVLPGVGPAGYGYYAYRPILPQLLLSAFFRIFGVGEFQARVFLLLFSMGAIALFFFLCHRIFENRNRSAFIGTLVFTATPLFLIYGLRVPHFSVLLPCGLAAAILYLRSLERCSASTLAALGSALIACSSSDWAGYYLCLALLMHQVLFRPRSPLICGVVVLAPLVSLALYVLHLWILDGYRWTLLKTFVEKGSFNVGPLSVGRLEGFLQEVVECLELLTAPVIFFAVAGVQALVRGPRSPRQFLPLLLLLFGLDEVMFPSTALHHRFLMFLIVPGALLLAGHGFMASLGRWSRRRATVAISALVILFTWQVVWAVYSDRTAVPLARDEAAVRTGLAISKSVPDDAPAFVIGEFATEATLRYYSERLYMQYDPERETLIGYSTKPGRLVRARRHLGRKEFLAQFTGAPGSMYVLVPTALPMSGTVIEFIEAVEAAATAQSFVDGVKIYSR